MHKNKFRNIHYLDKLHVYCLKNIYMYIYVESYLYIKELPDKHRWQYQWTIMSKWSRLTKNLIVHMDCQMNTACLQHSTGKCCCCPQTCRTSVGKLGHTRLEHTVTSVHTMPKIVPENTRTHTSCSGDSPKWPPGRFKIQIWFWCTGETPDFRKGT